MTIFPDIIGYIITRFFSPWYHRNEGRRSLEAHLARQVPFSWVAGASNKYPRAFAHTTSLFLRLYLFRMINARPRSCSSRICLPVAVAVELYLGARAGRVR